MSHRKDAGTQRAFHFPLFTFHFPLFTFTHASGRNRANANAPAAYFDHTKRIVEKRRKPPIRPPRPRPGEHTPVNDDDPDARKAMGRSQAGSNAQYLALVDDSRYCARKSPARCSLHSSQLICHGMPKRSTSMPNRAAQNVFSSGSRTFPPLASSWKIRSASATLLI